jgi:hypothetical protein
MADDWHAAPPGPGERWNINLPAVVGVVFVFLLGVVIWVVAASAGSGDDAAPPIGESLPSAPSTTASVLVPVTVPAAGQTTSPLPETTLVSPSTLPAPPVTTAPAAPVTTVPSPATTTTNPTTTTTTASSPLPTAPPEAGDLGVPGHTIQRPPCDDAYITILGSAIGAEATPGSMAATLDEYPGSHYLRTDLTCPSLTQSQNGQPIYVIYFGPFVVDSDACNARHDGPNGAYVRRLSDHLTPAHSVNCN